MAIVDNLSGGRGWRRWVFGAASLLVHAVLLAALVIATDEEATPATTSAEEEVTYVDISSFPPPPPPASAAPQQPEPSQPQETQPTPRPAQPRPQPQTPPRATDIVEPEPDSIPEEPLGTVPAPAPVQGPVAEGPPAGAVTSGRPGGQAGGVEGGVEGGREGGQVGAVAPEGGTFVAAVVDRKAELSNRRDLPRIMERLYPPSLRDQRVGGRVVMQFVVGTNGRVDMATVKVMSADHDELVEATRRALGEFRFTPARMGDRPVRMLTQMPVVWQIERL